MTEKELSDLIIQRNRLSKEEILLTELQRIDQIDKLKNKADNYLNKPFSSKGSVLEISTNHIALGNDIVPDIDDNGNKILSPAIYYIFFDAAFKNYLLEIPIYSDVIFEGIVLEINVGQKLEMVKYPNYQHQDIFLKLTKIKKAD